MSPHCSDQRCLSCYYEDTDNSGLYSFCSFPTSPDHIKNQFNCEQNSFSYISRQIEGQSVSTVFPDMTGWLT
ncbi:hypothetical protein XELAEV_18001247mg [Xenopus laevis]|nr:hypothetical protein XELAEV_18001247mg [Xenopus laevis]